MSKQIEAGPPPFTITCEPLPTQPPLSYDEAMKQAPYNPAAMPQGAPYNYPVQSPWTIPPQPAPQPSVIVVSAPPQVLVSHVALPEVSARLTCPSCKEQISSRVDYAATTKTHLWAFGLFLFGCWPCCCIPYCMESCQTANHYCPSCQAYIGSAY